MSAASHDSIEPTGSGRDWSPLSIWTALILATVLALVTYFLTGGGDPITDRSDLAAAVVDQTTTTAEAPAPTTAAPAPTTTASEPVEAEEPLNPAEGDDIASSEELPAIAAGGGDALGAASSFAASAESIGVAAMGVITNMGPTEVGFTTNFPTVAYNWERIELDAEGPGQLGWLGVLNGTFVSIGQTYEDFASEAPPSLVTAVSSDGLSWKVAGTYVLPENTWISNIVSDGEQVFAVGQTWEEFGRNDQYVLYRSTDGVDWSTVDLDITTEPDEHVYVNNAAMGPAGVILSVNFETYPEEPPIVLTFEPYEVTVSHSTGSYTLVDLETGETVVSGPLEEVYNWGGEGQNIFDPESGELLTVVPWQVWESAWGSYYGGSPLPLPIDYGQSRSEVTVEYDGYVILIDEGGDEYVVTAAESGDEVARGTMEQLYQGLPPTFRDPDTGEVIFSVTWDEWYQAEEEAWMSREGEDYFYEYRSRTALFTSTDGETWSEQTVSDGTGGGSTSYLVATDDGFVAMVNTYSEFAESGEVWTMSNGVWSSTPAERSDLWFSNVVVTAEGMVAVGEGAGGPALWSSSDGVGWSSEFAIVPQDDGSYAWLADVSADRGTVGALTVKERWSGYQPLVIEQDAYTATFEDGEVALRITENATGAEVLVLGWQQFEDGSAAELVSWDGEATSITLDNGDVMVIGDEDARAASESRYAESGEFGLSVFLSDGNTWTEAVVDVEGAISGASQLLLADGTIIIGGNYWSGGELYYEGGGESNAVVIVGTPIGG